VSVARLSKLLVAEAIGRGLSIRAGADAAR